MLKVIVIFLRICAGICIAINTVAILLGIISFIPHGWIFTEKLNSKFFWKHPTIVGILSVIDFIGALYLIYVVIVLKH